MWLDCRGWVEWMDELSLRECWMLGLGFMRGMHASRVMNAWRMERVRFKRHDHEDIRISNAVNSLDSSVKTTTLWRDSIVMHSPLTHFKSYCIVMNAMQVDANVTIAVQVSSASRMQCNLVGGATSWRQCNLMQRHEYNASYCKRHECIGSYSAASRIQRTPRSSDVHALYINVTFPREENIANKNLRNIQSRLGPTGCCQKFPTVCLSLKSLLEIWTLHSISDRRCIARMIVLLLWKFSS